MGRVLSRVASIIEILRQECRNRRVRIWFVYIYTLVYPKHQSYSNADEHESTEKPPLP